MSDSVETKGFTPVFDTVAGAVVGSKKMGLVGAAVYGIVWRHCQMRRKVCDAATETMADQLGVSRKTIHRHLKNLCDLGYIDDLTPDRRNGPHTYITTDKVTFRVSIEAGEQDPGESESPTDNPVGLRVPPVGLRVPPVGLRVPPPVGQRVPQGDSLEDTNKEISKRGSHAPAQNSSSSQTAAAKPGKDVHPAIRVVKTVVGDYPRRAAYQTIIKAVGDNPADLARWEAILVAGQVKGWKPGNMEAPLDYFDRGEIPGQNGHNGKTQNSGPKSRAVAFIDPATGERFPFDTPGRVEKMTPEKIEAYKHLAGETEPDSVSLRVGARLAEKSKASMADALIEITGWFKEAGGTNDQARQNRTLFVDLLEKHRDTKTFEEIGKMAYSLARQNEHIKSLDVMNGGTPRL